MPRWPSQPEAVSKTRLYYVWQAMVRRCSSPYVRQYKDYGGRGIRVCDEWSTFLPFSLWAKETGYAQGLTIERKDVDGPYSPDNCKWIPRSDQALNTTRSLRTPDGELWVMKASANGIRRGCFYQRVHHGWAPERASTVPLYRPGQKKDYQ